MMSAHRVAGDTRGAERRRVDDARHQVAILALALAAITWLSFGSDSGPTTIALTRCG